MISKIIQKEKERQKYYIANRFYGAMAQQKQSLINLKEYLEGEITEWIHVDGLLYTPRTHKRIIQLKEDIQALTKMIGRYE